MSRCASALFIILILSEFNCDLAILLPTSRQFSPVAVYSEAKDKYPEGTRAATELLRFVTPFGAEQRHLVDLTPYTPLLQVIAKNLSTAPQVGLGLYASVDTWVSDSRGKKHVQVRPLRGKLGVCKLEEDPEFSVADYGNGWGLSANLVFWPRKKNSMSIQPRQAITLATGMMGSTYPVGNIDILEGVIQNNSVRLQNPANFKDAVNTACFACDEGVASFHKAKKLGELANQAEATHSSDEFLWKIYADQVKENLQAVTPVMVNRKKRMVEASYDARKIQIQPGSLVFFQNDNDGDVSLDPVGQVTDVKDNSNSSPSTLQVQLTPTACLPAPLPPKEDSFLEVAGSATFRKGAPDDWWPRLLIAKNPNVLSEAASFAHLLDRRNSTTQKGRHALLETSHSIRLEGDLQRMLETNLTLMHVHKGAIAPLPYLGKVGVGRGRAERARHLALLQTNAATSEDEGAVAKNGQKVCVLKQERSGRFFSKTFDVPPLATGDRVIAQLAITGHGWQFNQDQCGEFCHGRYGVSFNELEPVVVDQFRKDCASNPIRHQHGTYKYSRDGWCPGSVSPGTFFDVTNLIQSNEHRSVANTVSIDYSVFNRSIREWQPYSNLAGFPQGDTATIVMSFNLFVYDAAVVQELKERNSTHSAAEVALLGGATSTDVRQNKLEDVPDAPRSFLQNHQNLAVEESGPLADVAEPYERLTEEGSSFTQAVADAPGDDMDTQSWATDADDGLVDFEKHKPWYDSRKAEADLLQANVVRVPLFTDDYMEAGHRTAEMENVLRGMPSDWEQVALELKLGDPPVSGLHMDRWDRIGSIGVLFHSDTPGVDLHSKEDREVEPLLHLAP